MAPEPDNLKATSFSSSDAWLLHSLYYAAGESNSGLTLRNIIATGDYLNHAVFTFEELRGGLERLGRIGYAEKRDGLYFLGDAFYADLNRSGRIPKSTLKQGEHLEKMLKKKTSGAGEISLPDNSEYEAAVRAYLPEHG